MSAYREMFEQLWEATVELRNALVTFEADTAISDEKAYPGKKSSTAGQIFAAHRAQRRLTHDDLATMHAAMNEIGPRYQRLLDREAESTKVVIKRKGK